MVFFKASLRFVTVVLCFLFYNEQALRLAPMDGDDMDKDFVAMVYANRATTMHVSLIPIIWFLHLKFCCSGATWAGRVLAHPKPNQYCA